MNQIMNRNIYGEQKKKALSHRRLYHYTKLEAFLHILRESRFRLSQLSSINDPLEYRRLSPFIKDKIFVACFNHIEKDTIPMWKMYADGPYGIRLSFKLSSLAFFENPSNYQWEKSEEEEENNNPSSNWIPWDASIIDVLYCEDLDEFNINRNYLGDDGPPTIEAVAEGIVKKDDWAYEKETRVRVAIKNKKPGIKGIKPEGFKFYTPPFRHVYCSIPKETLSEMEITFSPFMSDVIQETIIRETKHYVPNISDDKFKKSKIVIGHY